MAGAATYLGWSQARDPRLFTAYRQWEAPLETALRLAPAKREPARFLAAAYLEIWPALSPRKREIARGLLAEVFRDPDDLDRLIDPWLDTAADRSEAFAVLPDEPRGLGAGREVLRQAAATSPGSRRPAGGGSASLLSGLRRDLAGGGPPARRRPARGGPRRSTSSVAERARPEARYLPLLAAGPRALPAAARSTAHRRPARPPARPRPRPLPVRAACDLPPAALKRLAHFVRDPAPSQAALASLFAGDLPRASLYERRTEGLGTEAWAPYLIAKARALAARGRVDEAREALALVHLSWQGEAPLYLAGAGPRWRAPAADPRRRGAGRRPPRRARPALLGAADWTWSRGTARLEMLTAAPAAGLAPWRSTRRRRTARWSSYGSTARPWVILRSGRAPEPRRRFSVAAPLGRGLHVLEVEASRRPGPARARSSCAERSRVRAAAAGAEQHRQGHGVARHGEAEVEQLVDGEGDQDAEGRQGGGAVLGAAAARAAPRQPPRQDPERRHASSASAEQPRRSPAPPGRRCADATRCRAGRPAAPAGRRRGRCRAPCR